jgi:hypothetical protein
MPATLLSASLNQHETVGGDATGSCTRGARSHGVMVWRCVWLAARDWRVIGASLLRLVPGPHAVAEPWGAFESLRLRLPRSVGEGACGVQHSVCTPLRRSLLHAHHQSPCCQSLALPPACTCDCSPSYIATCPGPHVSALRPGACSIDTFVVLELLFRCCCHTLSSFSLAASRSAPPSCPTRLLSMLVRTLSGRLFPWKETSRPSSHSCGYSRPRRGS